MGSKNSKLQTSKSQQISKPQHVTSGLKKSKRAGQLIQHHSKKESVFDQDSREIVNQANTLRFIGFIRTKFKSKDKSSIGTGIIVDEDLILTVAHNICSRDIRKFRKYRQELTQDIFESNGSSSDVYSTSKSSQANTKLESTLKQSQDGRIGIFKSANKNYLQETSDFIEYPQWIQFYPAVNGRIKGLINIQDIQTKHNSEDNYYQIQKYIVHPKYLTEVNYRQYDIGLLKLKKKIRIEDKDRVKILQNYEAQFQPEISLYGYPKDKCFKKTEEGADEVRQVGTKGRYRLNIQKGYISYTMATNPGQSGSPIFINTLKNNKDEIFCIGIHAGSWKQQNFGLYINTQKYKDICSMQQKLTGKCSSIQKIVLPELPSTNKVKPAGKDVHTKSLQQYQKEICLIELKQEKETQNSKMLIYYYKRVAYSYLERQNYAKSAQFYEKFVKLIEKDIQRDRQRQENEHDIEECEIALINLAKCYSQLNKLDQSLALYSKVQQMMEINATATIEKISTIMNNRGAVLVQQQKYENALELFKKSYKLRKEKLGSEHIMTVNSLQNVASVNLKLSIDVQQQLKTYQKVLSAKQKRYGAKSKQYISTQINLALAYFQLKRYKQFLQSYFIAIKIQQSIVAQHEKKTYNSKAIDNFCGKLKILLGEQCELQCLKLGAQMAKQINRHQLQLKLKQQWQKRYALLN